MSWFWLSFIDPRRPKDDQFLGVCIIEADVKGTTLRETAIAVFKRAWLLGINPGGEAMITELRADFTPFEKYVNKLFTDRAEVEEMRKLPASEIGTFDATKIH